MARGRAALAVFVAVLVLTLARASSAETLAATAGGKAISVAGHVFCLKKSHDELTAAGWTMSADARSLRPPLVPTSNGSAVEVGIATSLAACNSSTRVATILASGPWPTLSDTAPPTLFLDEGRLELHG